MTGKHVKEPEQSYVCLLTLSLCRVFKKAGITLIRSLHFCLEEEDGLR